VEELGKGIRVKRFPLRERYKPACPHEPDILSDCEAYREWTKGWNHVVCPYGNCQIDICQYCSRITGGFGPILCPCDHTRGWKAKRVESMGKPHPPIKPTGRHKGKIERRRREMREFNQRMKRYGRLFDNY
jgi:hypothetical protein